MTSSRKRRLIYIALFLACEIVRVAAIDGGLIRSIWAEAVCVAAFAVPAYLFSDEDYGWRSVFDALGFALMFSGLTWFGSMFFVGSTGSIGPEDVTDIALTCVTFGVLEFLVGCFIFFGLRWSR